MNESNSAISQRANSILHADQREQPVASWNEIAELTDLYAVPFEDLVRESIKSAIEARDAGYLDSDEFDTLLRHIISVAINHRIEEMVSDFFPAPFFSPYRHWRGPRMSRQ